MEKSFLISFIGRDDLNASGGLNRSGPLFRLLQSRSFGEAFLFFSTRTRKAADELKAEFGGSTRKRPILLAQSASSKAASAPLVRAEEFPELQDFERMKKLLELKVREVSSGRSESDVSIHMDGWRASTVAALTVLVASQRIRARLVQVQLPFGDPDGPPVISELSLPEKRKIGTLGVGPVPPQLDQASQILNAAERVGLVGADSRFCSLLEAAHRCSLIAGMHVLIGGEAGTGKLLLARFMHALIGPGGQVPWIKVDCRLDSETVAKMLFDPGASAYSQAHGGCLVLQHVDALSRALQAKLIAKLERSHAMNPRVIATSGKDVSGLVVKGEFESELYERLRGRLQVLPLRERTDVNFLAGHFLDDWNRLNGTSLSLSAGLKSHFKKHDWPANVAGLKSAVIAAAECASGKVLKLGDVVSLTSSSQKKLPEIDLPEFGSDFSLPNHLAGIEARMVQEALHKTRGNQTAAGALLGMEKGPIGRCVRKYGLARS